MCRTALPEISSPASWAALVALLVEHWPRNLMVTGWNPIQITSVFVPCLLGHVPLLWELICTCTCASTGMESRECG